MWDGEARHPTDSIAEPGRGASFRFCRFFFPILRWRVRFERMEEAAGNGSYFVDSGQECGFICLRRLVESADFPYELEGGILNLWGGNWRIKVEKCFDIPAHS